MRYVLVFYACFTVLVAGCGGGSAEEDATPVFPPTGETTDEQLAAQEAGGEANQVTIPGAAESAGDLEEEPSYLICADGTFGCQNGTLLACQNDQFVVVEVCEVATDCNPTDGDCGGCEPDCEGKLCGDDGCGNSCGSCGTGQNCESGNCVPVDVAESDEPSGSQGGGEPTGEQGGNEGGGQAAGGGGLDETVECIPLGTGKDVGQYAKNVAWKDSDAEWFELHHYCGTEIILLIASADW